MPLGIKSGSGYALRGASGSGPGSAPHVYVVPFTFATPSPLVIVGLSPGQYVMRGEVQITVTFNGVGAGLQLGVPSSVGALLATLDIDVTVVDFYRTFDPFTVGVAENVQLTITPGAGATQGAGVVFLEVWQP